jgi:Mg2+ and Co2+ transporter CorA
MNRRDAAFLAHLDAIESRFALSLARIEAKLDAIQDDITRIRTELATHRHGGKS